MTSRFDEWYEEHWGKLPGGDDPENRDALRRMWNHIVERVAHVFEINEFDDLGPEEVARKLRDMKEPRE